MKTLVEEIANRLAAVTQQTDGLLASAEELAASGQEQSASTEEIAASANRLAEAADKLTGAVKSFRLLSDEEQPPPRSGRRRTRVRRMTEVQDQEPPDAWASELMTASPQATWPYLRHNGWWSSPK